MGHFGTHTLIILCCHIGLNFDSIWNLLIYISIWGFKNKFFVGFIQNKNIYENYSKFLKLFINLALNLFKSFSEISFPSSKLITENWKHFSSAQLPIYHLFSHGNMSEAKKNMRKKIFLHRPSLYAYRQNSYHPSMNKITICRLLVLIRYSVGYRHKRIWSQNLGGAVAFHALMVSMHTNPSHANVYWSRVDFCDIQRKKWLRLLCLPN